jgi:type IV secretory pathway TraG/TraD family ATPase VirD4
MAQVFISLPDETNGFGEAVVIKTKDRRQHVYILGKTGAGKSTLIKNMAIQDIRNGAGVAVVDPHGDLAEDLLRFIPKTRINDVVYFNPADVEFPAGLNILEVKTDDEKQLVASSLVSVFKHLWRDSWGPRTEYLLYNSVLALMDTPGNSLLGVYRILVDAEFRKRIIDKVQDPMVKMFWVEDFERYNERFVKEIIAPVQNKVGQLLTSSYLRNIVGQTKSTIDLKSVIDNKNILLVNLAKGRIGEDRANLLGSIITTKLYLAALERQTMPEDERKDFYLYVDEFQSFSTDIFPSILSESRKYRLNLILSHQYLDQVPETIKNSVFGNVGTWIIFRIGSFDAVAIEKEFFPYFNAEEMSKQKNYHFIYKTIINGVVGDPGTEKAMAPLLPFNDEAEVEAIIKLSRKQFARPRLGIEQKIGKWFSI